MKHSFITTFSRTIKAALLLSLLAIFSSSAWAEKINLNTADAQTMQYIPGIGVSKSKKIVEVRLNTGGFDTMQDVDAVPGIGQRTMIDIKKHGSLDSGVSELTEEMKANRPARSVSTLAKKTSKKTS